MGLRHRELPVEGVQFHPESVLTEYGHLMLANWLAECGDPGGAGPRRRRWPPRWTHSGTPPSAPA